MDTNQIIAVPPLAADESIAAVGLAAARVGVRLGLGVGRAVVAVDVAVAGAGVGVSVAGGVTCKSSF
jgi:hypothetical protein